MSVHYTDEECIKDLTTLQEFYQTIYGAEPVCLGHAKKRLKALQGQVEIKVIGEAKEGCKKNEKKL